MECCSKSVVPPQHFLSPQMMRGSSVGHTPISMSVTGNKLVLALCCSEINPVMFPYLVAIDPTVLLKN